MGPLIIPLTGLLFAAAWWWSARMAWGRTGFGARAWWKRWGPGTAALLYPAYLVGAMALRRWYDRDMLGIDAVAWLLFFASGLPTLLVGGLTAAAARGPGSLAVMAGAVAASVAGPSAFFFFERGTHGAWYIQNEGLAMAASAGVGSAAWLACMATGTLLWSMLAVRRRKRLRGLECAICGYDLGGSVANVCPECGCSR